VTGTAPLGAEEPLLRLDRLSAGFEGRVVFRSLSLDLSARGITAIMGPAGVGKSTLLRTLGRWNEPHPSFWTHGHVWFSGRDLLHEVDLIEARRKIALLAQKARLFTATVLDNAIAIVGEGRQMTFAEKRGLAREVLQPWGLWDELESRLDAPVTTLSLARQRMLSVARLMSGGAECVLVDEPLRDIAVEERADLASLLSRLSVSHAVVLVTHDQREARQLADTVCLVAAGQLVEMAPAEQFFTEPGTDLGREFLRSGTCWPSNGAVSWSAPEPDRAGAQPEPRLPLARRPSWLPTAEESAPRPGGFHWVVSGKLGGMQWPGLLADEATDLSGLAALGVRHLVSLTEVAFDARKLETHGILGAHFPIVDMGVPRLEDALRFCRRISDWMASGGPTVVHCKAGLGRTGTILACTLIVGGYDAVRAIHEVRQVNPLYIQSEVQLAFIGEFGRRLHSP
jgi:atypical dual specificity phosphatase